MWEVKNVETSAICTHMTRNKRRGLVVCNHFESKTPRRGRTESIGSAEERQAPSQHHRLEGQHHSSTFFVRDGRKHVRMIIRNYTTRGLKPSERNRSYLSRRRRTSTKVFWSAKKPKTSATYQTRKKESVRLTRR